MLPKQHEIELYKFLQKKWDSVFPKKYHWYDVVLNYKDKNGVVVFYFNRQIGVSDQATVLNYRKAKKIIYPLHKFSDKKYLTNGTLEIVYNCYLGYFSPKFK